MTPQHQYARALQKLPFARVIPLSKADKVALINGWGNGGQRDGWSASVSDIDYFWGKWPDANPGLLTGLGLIVVDVDLEKSAAAESFKQLETKYGKLADTVSVRTPKGGFHLYFILPDAAPDPHQCIGYYWWSHGGMGSGIDIKCDHNLVVAVGAVGSNGKMYDWINKPTPAADCGIRLMPEEMWRDLLAFQTPKRSERLWMPERQPASSPMQALPGPLQAHRQVLLEHVALRRAAADPRAESLEALAHGLPFAPHGNRHQAGISLASSIGCWLPELTLSTMEALFLPSCEIMDSIEPFKTGIPKFIDILWECYETFAAPIRRERMFCAAMKRGFDRAEARNAAYFASLLPVVPQKAPAPQPVVVLPEDTGPAYDHGPLKERLKAILKAMSTRRSRQNSNLKVLMTRFIDGKSLLSPTDVPGAVSENLVVAVEDLGFFIGRSIKQGESLDHFEGMLTRVFGGDAEGWDAIECFAENYDEGQAWAKKKNDQLEVARARIESSTQQLVQRARQT